MLLSSFLLYLGLYISHLVEAQYNNMNGPKYFVLPGMADSRNQVVAKRPIY